MIEEQKELYLFTKDKYNVELHRISPNCIAPLIAVRQFVRNAIYKYMTDHCSKEINPLDIFSEEDFKAVSERICNEIMEGVL